MQATAQTLQSGSVHVWCVDLDNISFGQPGLLGIVSPGERLSGRAMSSNRLRRRYFARMAFRRLVLAKYAETSPRRISFSLGRFGKPGLAAPLRRAGLRFSASSSGSAAVLAVSRAGDVGVDIEAVRSVRHRQDVAAWANDAFAGGWTSTDGLDETAFFRNWTSLEARAKCSGTGLADHDDGAARGRSTKTMVLRSAGTSFVVSLATEHSSTRIRGPFHLIPSREEATWRRS